MQDIPLPPQIKDSPTSEQIAMVRITYRLWRVDTAARAFPYEMEDELLLMRARWSIGLVQELVCCPCYRSYSLAPHPLA